MAAHYEAMTRGQSERLFPILDQVLADAGAVYQDLDAVGVATGPGNFTGLRIAVSAARGLALSLGIPAVGVTLFDALALDAPEAPLALLLRAPQEKFYLQTRVGTVISEVEITSLDAFPKLTPETYVIGHGAEQVAAHLGCAFAPAAFTPASAVARLAATRFQSETDRPAPFYLRPPDAAPSSDTPPVILP